MIKRIFTALSAALLLSIAVATPAHAAPLDGQSAFNIPDCMRYSKRIGDAISIWGWVNSSNQDYYGWAEWRYGTGGNCRDYQWVRLHLTAPLDAPPMASYEVQLYLRVFRANGSYLAQTMVAHRTSSYNNTLPATDYNSVVIYAPNDLLCSDLLHWLPANHDMDNTNLRYYGTGGVQKNFCA